MARITVDARGGRVSTGIMGSQSGIIRVDRSTFLRQKTHSIFSAPLNLNTRLTSWRPSMTAEPGSAPEVRHVGTQSGIHAVASAPQYPLPSPLLLGQPAVNGSAQSSFGIPTVRGALDRPGQVMIPIMNRKVLNTGRAGTGKRASNF